MDEIESVPATVAASVIAEAISKGMNVEIEHGRLACGCHCNIVEINGKAAGAYDAQESVLLSQYLHSVRYVDAFAGVKQRVAKIGAFLGMTGCMLQAKGARGEGHEDLTDAERTFVNAIGEVLEQNDGEERGEVAIVGKGDGAVMRTTREKVDTLPEPLRSKMKEFIDGFKPFEREVRRMWAAGEVAKEGMVTDGMVKASAEAIVSLNAKAEKGENLGLYVAHMDRSGEVRELVADDDDIMGVIIGGWIDGRAMVVAAMEKGKGGLELIEKAEALIVEKDQYSKNMTPMLSMVRGLAGVMANGYTDGADLKRKMDRAINGNGRFGAVEVAVDQVKEAIKAVTTKDGETVH